MTKKETNILVETALANENEELAVELLSIAWRISNLAEKNAKLESLVNEVTEMSTGSAIEIAIEPKSWKGEFETEEVRYFREKFQPLMNGELGGILTKGVESLRASVMRNRVLREAMDEVRYGLGSESEAHSKEWSEKVLVTVKEQGECQCGCGCHFCSLCASNLIRERRICRRRPSAL